MNPRLRAGCAATATALAFLALTPPATAAPPDFCDDYARDSRDRELHPTGSGPRTVVIGDSYSLGVGLTDTTEAWPSMIPGRVQVFGFGGSGFSLDASPCGEHVAFTRRAPAALETRPDLVIIEGGLNDTSETAAEIRAGFRALISQVGDRSTLVIGPALSPARAARATRVDAILRAEAARAGKPYLSMINEHFVYLGRNQLHIDLAGHRAYAALVATALRQIAQGRQPDAAQPPPPEEPPTTTTSVTAHQQPADDDTWATPTLIGLILAAVLAAGTAFRFRTRRQAPGRRRR